MVAFVDQVARIVRLSEEQILLKAARIDRVIFEKLLYALQSEVLPPQTPKVLNELLN
jgi:hypothetical protein